MSENLVNRLRGIYPGNHKVEPNGLELKAADRIEALEAALQQILDLDPPFETGNKVAFKMASIAHLVLEHDGCSEAS